MFKNIYKDSYINHIAQMKKITLIAFIVLVTASLYSCQTCYDCRRTWITSGQPDIKEIEDFEVCGKDEMKDAEKNQKRYIIQDVDTTGYRSGSCSCWEID
jgi:hypothetical protein